MMTCNRLCCSPERGSDGAWQQVCWPPTGAWTRGEGRGPAPGATPDTAPGWAGAPGAAGTPGTSRRVRWSAWVPRPRLRWRPGLAGSPGSGGYGVGSEEPDQSRRTSPEYSPAEPPARSAKTLAASRWGAAPPRARAKAGTWEAG